MLCSRVSTGIHEKKYIFPLTNNTRVFCRQRVFLCVEIIENQSLSELGKSDVVIVYIQREQGGAHIAMKYAEKLKKKIINIY